MNTTLLDLEVDTLGKELSVDEKEVLRDVEDTEKEIEEYLRFENELSELEGEEEENPNEVFTIPVDSLSGESYELSIELDTQIDNPLSGEEAQILAELYGELAEAQELGFLKKVFKKIKKAFRKLGRFIRRKPLKAAIITSAVIGAGALAYKHGLFSKAKAWLLKKKRAFSNWLRWKKWQIRRALVRRRWITRVRKLKKKHPKTWFSKLKRYWRRRIILRTRNQLNRYLKLWRRTRKRIYLNAYRRLLKAHRRLIRDVRRPIRRAVRRPIRRVVRRPIRRAVRRPIRRVVRRAVRRAKKPIPAIMPVKTQQRRVATAIRKPVPSTPKTQNKELQEALMPLVLFTGGFMLFRMLRG